VKVKRDRALLSGLDFFAWVWKLAEGPCEPRPGRFLSCFGVGPMNCATAVLGQFSMVEEVHPFAFFLRFKFGNDG